MLREKTCENFPGVDHQRSHPGSQICCDHVRGREGSGTMTKLGVRMTNARGTMSSLVMLLVAVVMTRVVEGQADLLASVIEFSDYPEEIKFSDYPEDDSDLMRRLDNGVPINVIQRPVTGLQMIIWRELLPKSQNI